MTLHKEGINFCKAYNEERKWCRAHNIDYRQLPEEIVFQEIVRMNKFKQMRQQVFIDHHIRSRFINVKAKQRAK